MAEGPVKHQTWGSPQVVVVAVVVVVVAIFGALLSKSANAQGTNASWNIINGKA